MGLRGAGRMAEPTTTMLTLDRACDLVERMLRSSGRRVALGCPVVDAVLPEGRLHVVTPDITGGHGRLHVGNTTDVDGVF